MQTIGLLALGFVLGFAGWNGYLNWRLRRALMQAERLLQEQETERLRIVAKALGAPADQAERNELR
jgi:hypothetical protein